MIDILERLRQLNVADVMQRQVVSVSPYQTMVEAAAVLSGRYISGAPVVDEWGHCVGVLTAQDYVRRIAATAERSPPHHTPFGSRTDLLEERLGLPMAERERDCVAHYMSTAVQPISQTASLLRATQMMCAMHVHRLPVLDEEGAPVGIVTSLDIVAALVNAAQEVTP